MRRFRLCVTMAVLAATASSAAFGVGYLRIHPANPHYFQEAGTGKPVLLAGYQSVVPTDASYDYTNGANGINTLKARRVGYSRVWHFLPWALGNAIWPWGRSITPGAPMGGNKIDMNTWNTTYWTRMNDALSKANAGGIYCGLHLFDRCGMSPAGPERWQGNPWASNNNINGLETPLASSDGVPEFYWWSTSPNLQYQQERYVRKMIDETIAYPNVIYEVENEHTATSIGWADHYSQFVKDYIAANYPNSPRLVSYNSIKNGDVDLDKCFAMPSLDIINKHFGGELEADPSTAHAYLETRWAYNKAISIDEFANGATDTNILRQECWTIITSGGNFHIEDADPASEPYDVVAGIRSFLALSGWDFIHAAPNSSLITSGGGYCMAQPGVEYLCYFPTGGSKTVTLNSGDYRVEWWNPRTGGFYNTSTISHGGGGRTLSTPDSNDWALHVTTQAATTTVLESKPAAGITVDGSSSDWSLGGLTTKIHGGDTGAGDIGIVGYDTDGVCYSSGHASDRQYPPSSATDHAVRFYSRHDAGYLYFLVRCDDSDLRYPNAVASNYLNDCVEFYIDPSHSQGSTAISSSTSNAQLVFDANNQRNAYGCTTGYANQILAGVISSVVRDSSGWWLEVRIAKNVFSPAIPAAGTVGLDLDFRDNDSDGSSTLSTVYTWRDPEVSSSFPTKIPDRWGELALLQLPDTTPPGPAASFTATAGDGQMNLSWHNPSDSDFTGTMIRYKTSGYPSSPTDGALVVDKAGTPSGNDSYVHTGLTNGTTCYYAAYAHDSIPNYSTAASTSEAPVYFTPAQAKVLADNTELTLTVGTVSAVFADSFYVQCTGPRCGVCGIKVVMAGHTLQPGQPATVEGTILTDAATGERYIAATWVNGTSP